MNDDKLLPAPIERRRYTWIIVLAFLAAVLTAAAFVIVLKVKKQTAEPAEAFATPEVSFSASTPAPTPKASVRPVFTPEPQPSQQSYVKTALVVDGSQCVVLSSREAAEELIRNVEKFFSSVDFIPKDAVSVLLNFIEYVPADESAETVDYDRAFEYLVGKDSPLVFESRATFVQYEPIEHKDSVVYSKYLPKGYRLVESYGVDGKLRLTYSAVYINGKQTEFNETERITVYPAVNGTVYIGTGKENRVFESYYFDSGAEPFPEWLELHVPAEGEVTAEYGLADGVFHHGIDIKKNPGAVIKAAADGVVVSVMERGAYGLMVEIDHGEGITTRYAKLGAVSVSVGQTVSAGQSIGTMSSRSSGAYFHFELRRRGYSYDPLLYFSDVDLLET